MRPEPFSVEDCRHMARALQLARKGWTTAHPNPRVGCVLVRDGAVVGEGWHRRTGGPHAEVEALQAGGAGAAGSTAYVTLEPCAHTGRTGPCSQALIDARVAEVVFALGDPSPHASGRGRAALEKAGVRVRSGLMEAQARQINEGFLSRVERGRPFVRVKIAASLDGGTAMRSGESQWITDAPARQDVQRLRAACGAILTGVGTVLADDPSLGVCDEALVSRPPLRVIVDSRLRTPPGARMLGLAGDTAIFCIDDGNRPALEKAGATIYRTRAAADRVDLVAVLSQLAEQGVNDLLVEAGPELSGSLLAADLVDELVIYQAPHIMGSETLRMFATSGRRALRDRLDLRIIDARLVGRDFRITARPDRQGSQ